MKNLRIAVTLLSFLGLFRLELIAAQPGVTTQAATSVTTANATLNGSVNPNGASTTAYFQYGLTTNYEHIGTATVLPASNVSSNIPGFVVSSLRDSTGPNVAETSLPLTWWGGVATSADGLRMAAAATAPGGIYLSTNAGATWTQSSAVVNYWNSIASSADGARLAAVPRTYGGIYISTDSGLTWTNSYPTNESWNSIASSSDGLRLAAAGSIGIHTSTNGGLTWTQSAGPALWQSIASSADGMRLGAVVYNGGILTSTNGGVTWTQSSAPGRQWQCIASSIDGSRLIAGARTGGGVYTSTDSGLTWQQVGLPTVDSWAAVASSADGTRVAAVGNRGFVYTSMDGGPWAAGDLASGWPTVALSADGTRLVTAQENGKVRTSAGALHNLLPGTAYHYRLVGLNSAGTTLGADQTFTTLGGAPTVATFGASGVTGSNAVINGAVNTGGSNTIAYFQYGLTTNYGSYSATNNLAATNTTLSVANLIGSLAPLTTYHFRLVGRNSAGTNTGADLTFTTGPLVPTVTTLAASDVAATNGTLRGTVNPNGIAASAYFQYGLTTNYGSFSATNSLAATNTTLTVSNLISSLAPGTTYHFRMVATNSAGTNLGGDLAFTTLAQPVIHSITHSGTNLIFGVTNGVPDGGWTLLTTTNLAAPIHWSTNRVGTFDALGSVTLTNGIIATEPRRFFTLQSDVGGIGSGWSAQYYKDANTASHLVGAPFATRTDATINFSSATGWPGTLVPSLGPSTFSVRWGGQLLVPATGSYTFYTASDDGVRLYLNGQPLIDNWTDHPPTTNSAAVTLNAGQFYPVVLEFYQAGGGSVISLEYEAPGAGVPRQIVPAAQVF